MQVWLKEKLFIKSIIKKEFESIHKALNPKNNFKLPKLLFSEHHLSHASSAFYPSPFKEAAILHSTSDTASNGGLIGWIKEDNLNQNIKDIISELLLGQLSKPIRTSSGFIIIKIEDKKEYVTEFNLAKKIEEVVRFKTDDQLSQFSSMYFNKLKKDLVIYGL